MDFSYTEAQQELSALARRVLTERPQWSDVAAAGLLDVLELTFLERCTVLIEVGRAAAPLPFLPTILGAGALARFYTTDEQARWAMRSAQGEIVFGLALTEEIPCSAEKTGDGFVLNGVFTTVLAGTSASVILMAIGEDVYLVHADAEGVTVEAQELVDGTITARVTLRDVTLSGNRVLPGAARWLRDRAVVGLCALQLGIAEKALEMTAAYATERVQFGRKIGGFQAVAQRLADAYIDVEAIRLTMWQAAWRLAEGLPCETEVHTAKFWACDGGHRVAHTAVHIHGGVGIDISYPLHRYFVAAKANEFLLGHATDHLLRIGETFIGESAG